MRKLGYDDKFGAQSTLLHSTLISPLFNVMTLKIALVQTNSLVGNIATNFNKIAETIMTLRRQSPVDLIVFPELALTGYPPEDLLFRGDFIMSAQNMLVELAKIAPEMTVIIGFPEFFERKLFNSAAVLRSGTIFTVYRKQKLPNYGVFDEQRYFSAGTHPCVFELKSQFIGVAICEDAWHSEIVAATKQAGAQLLVTLNASPFHSGKALQREAIIAKHAKAAHLPIVYVNAVGGQDELIFDGASFVINQAGEKVLGGGVFVEEVRIVEFKGGEPMPADCVPSYTPLHSEYAALVCATRDYVHKNGFTGAILGLSGGIDSALVLAIAVDALGAENVEAVSLPSRYTQTMSNEDAKIQAQTLGVTYHSIPIEPAVNAFSAMLEGVFSNTQQDTTEENIQARCRGIVLMAMSNKHGKLLLTTGNKSEMSVGYATLYGDMAGGFAPLKDVPKLLVYALARHRNAQSPVIPERVISRPPSAELAPNQCDADSLPPYEILDPILQRYIEEDHTAQQIIDAGFEAQAVMRAISLVDSSEYKRRQSPPGVRISERAFGRDRRYPITSGYRGT